MNEKETLAERIDRINGVGRRAGFVDTSSDAYKVIDGVAHRVNKNGIAILPDPDDKLDKERRIAARAKGCQIVGSL